MKTLLIATAIASITATAGFAGSVEYVAPVEQVVVAPTPSPWAGPYAGIVGSMGSGDIIWTDEGSWTEPVKGNMYGVFAGYNLQYGSMVFGGEVDYLFGSLSTPNPQAQPNNSEFTSFLDLKARAGLAAGSSALVYGFAGWTQSTLVVHGKTDTTYNPSGMNYGAGVDVLVTSNFFVGAEYIVRDLTQTLGPRTIDANIQAFQLRAGMNF